MFIEKPKRKARPQRQSIIRFLLILIMIVPVFFVIQHPRIGGSLFTDGIALSVMICAAVYIVHQIVLWLIACYTGILYDDSTPDSQEI